MPDSGLKVFLASSVEIVMAGLAAAFCACEGIQIVGQAATVEDLYFRLITVPCDVLIVDYLMQGEIFADGQQMIREVGRIKPGLPVVVMVDHLPPPALNGLSCLNVGGIVSKESPLSDFGDAVLAASGGTTYRSSSVSTKLKEYSLFSSMDDLSAREYEVVRLLAEGSPPRTVAARLGVSAKTISKQKKDAMRKLGIDSDADLYHWLRLSIPR